MCIEANKQHSLAHGDNLRIGKNTFLLHIHKGSTTCINCEPGEVMAKLDQCKSEIKSSNDIENSRRETNRELKKKYTKLI